MYSLHRGFFFFCLFLRLQSKRLFQLIQHKLFQPINPEVLISSCYFSCGWLCSSLFQTAPGCVTDSCRSCADRHRREHGTSLNLEFDLFNTESWSTSQQLAASVFTVAYHQLQSSWSNQGLSVSLKGTLTPVSKWKQSSDPPSYLGTPILSQLLLSADQKGAH